ncbi:MAG: hypothetical protein Q7S71_04385 [Candidatus Nitrotoga sp.]|nr:hypothetical protein [Candidatus Nitrotoga sp.]
MKKNAKPRGLESIRSISGLVTETTHPHRKFLKLAILAMEEARRSKEKTSSQRRIDNINDRLAEIKTETNGLLQVCNDIANTVTGDGLATQNHDSSNQTKRGFTLKY